MRKEARRRGGESTEEFDRGKARNVNEHISQLDCINSHKGSVLEIQEARLVISPYFCKFKCLFFVYFRSINRLFILFQEIVEIKKKRKEMQERRENARKRRKGKRKEENQKELASKGAHGGL